MCSQIFRLTRCIVTHITFERFFFSMSPQMSSQTVCMGRCKVAKVALMRFFSIVSFRMCPQMDCLRGSIRTTAIKGNNSLFGIIPYLVWFEWLIFIIFSWQLLVSLHTLHLCDFSLVLIFKCTRRRDAWTEVWSQKLHLCGFSPVWVFECSLRLVAQTEE